MFCFNFRSGFPVCHYRDCFDRDFGLQTRVATQEDSDCWNCVCCGIPLWIATHLWGKKNHSLLDDLPFLIRFCDYLFREVATYLTCWIITPPDGPTYSSVSLSWSWFPMSTESKTSWTISTTSSSSIQDSGQKLTSWLSTWHSLLWSLGYDLVLHCHKVQLPAFWVHFCPLSAIFFFLNAGFLHEYLLCGFSCILSTRNEPRHDLFTPPSDFQIILIVSWARYEPLTKGSYTYPEWANAIGWIIALTAILAVPAVAIFQIVYKIFEEYKDLDMMEVKLTDIFYKSFNDIFDIHIWYLRFGSLIAVNFCT